MKRTGLFSILLAAHLLLSPLPSLAGDRAGAFIITPFVGGYTFDGIEHCETTPVYGLRLGYDITNNWATEVMVDVASTKSTVTQQGVNIFSYRLDMLYNFMPEHALVPYLAIGGGGSYKEPKNDPEFNDATFNFGGGLKYFITDSLAIRGDVRQLFVFGGSETLYNWEYTVGLSYLFGGKKPVLSRAKPEPIPEPVAKPAAKPEPIPEPVAKPAAKPEPIPEPVAKPAAKPEPTTEPVAKPAAKPESTTDEAKTRITLNVLFYIDTAVILDESRREIGQVAAMIQQNSTATAVFDGHDANSKESEYNIVLSQRRVESLLNYLVDKFGIERSRLSVKGYGESRPTAKFSKRLKEDNKRSVNVMYDCVITR